MNSYLISTENLFLHFLKEMKRLSSNDCLVEISRDIGTLKDLIQFNVVVRRDWAAVTSLSSRILKPRHETAVSRRRSTKSRRETPRKVEQLLFSRARSRSLALPLFPFSVAAAVSRAPWNQVLPRGYLSPWQRIVSKQSVRFVNSARFPCVARAQLRANVSARRCVPVVRRCVARHYPHDF